MPARPTPSPKQPDPDALRRTLGPAAKAWDTLVAEISAMAGPPRPEWKFYGAKYGWQLKVVQAKRALIYLVPHDGYFMAALALNDEALARLADIGLPADRVRDIQAAKRGPEGQPARIEVRGARELGLVRRLLALKLSA